MTADRRLERDLAQQLTDLYVQPLPDYRDDLIGRIAATPQRPAWTFPGRWLPMSAITERMAAAPRVPWRGVGVLALLILALVAATILIVGSQQRRVPEPFGLAGNGLIAYAADGDIHTLDPVTGLTTAIVTGPENVFDPVFSHDGTRVAFRRDTTRDGSPAEEIVVVAADGSNPVVATAMLGDVSPGYFEWAPDSRSLLVEHPNGAAIWLLDAVTPSAPRLVATDATMTTRPFRPPDGDAILINRTVDGAPQIALLDLATGSESILVEGSVGLELGGARWSPRGDQVVYAVQPADARDTRRLVIVNADGSGEPLVVPGVDGNHFDLDPAWSHDGSRIAFSRWEQVDGDTWDVRPIMLFTVADGGVTEIGPRAREIRARAPSDADGLASAGEGLWLEFSPDADALIAMPSEATGHPALVDLDTGEWRALDILVKPAVASSIWQRLATGP